MPLYAAVTVNVRKGVTIEIRCKVLDYRAHFGRVDYTLETDAGSIFSMSDRHVRILPQAAEG